MSPNQQSPSRSTPRPPSSPRSISFASPASSSPSRPVTSSGRKLSDTTAIHEEIERGLSKGAQGTATTTSVWTDAQEERLILVRSELAKAQKRWSESQELWLEEEHELVELKKLHKKALKKEAATAKKAAGVWKAKTFGKKRLGSLRPTRKNSNSEVPTTRDERKNNSDDEDDDNGSNYGNADTESDDEISKTNSHELTQTPSTSSTLSSAIRRLSFSIRPKRSTGTGPGTPDLTSSLGSIVVSRDQSPRR